MDIVGNKTDRRFEAHFGFHGESRCISQVTRERLAVSALGTCGHFDWMGVGPYEPVTQYSQIFHIAATDLQVATLRSFCRAWSADKERFDYRVGARGNIDRNG